MRVEGRRRTVSLVLFAVALGLLGAGGFVQFRDTSGFGSSYWIFPLGLLSVVPAVAAVVVAWPERGSAAGGGCCAPRRTWSAPSWCRSSSR
ncbi:hypothetical protein E0H45_22965 [Kribbella soli]|uniref:Uncharacterized protein n=1 Tax=Kribbella soli TaxID=1124743 RepID=A0A4R0H329_9ACTN|nr:hypothetical protein E0H45_22965 [Kribbella soli]